MRASDLLPSAVGVSSAPAFLGELPGDGLDNVLGLTGLKQVSDDRVAQVVDRKPGKADGVRGDRQAASHFLAGLVGS